MCRQFRTLSSWRGLYNADRNLSCGGPSRAHQWSLGRSKKFKIFVTKSSNQGNFQNWILLSRKTVFKDFFDFNNLYWKNLYWNNIYYIFRMAQARVELAFILYFAKIYTVLFTLMELGLFIYKVRFSITIIIENTGYITWIVAGAL